MRIAGTILIGPNAPNPEKAVISLLNAGCERVFGLIDFISFEVLKRLESINELELIYDKWDYNFSRSRNVLRQKVIDEGYDLMFWLDADDFIADDDIVKVKEEIQTIDSNTVGIFPYCYLDSEGNVTFKIVRERIFDPRSGKWKLHAHEYFSYDREMKPKPIDCPVYHFQSGREKERDEKICEGLKKDLLDPELEKDKPRILFYLGQTYCTVDKDLAIQYLEDYLRISTWNEERMVANLYLSSVFEHKGDFSKALEYAIKASEEVNNQRREPLHAIARLNRMLGNDYKSLEALKKMVELPLQPSGILHVIEPLYGKLPYEMILDLSHILSEDEIKYYSKELEKFNVTSSDRSQSEVDDRKERKVLRSRIENNPRKIFFHVGLSSEEWDMDSINTTGIGGRETSNIWMAKEFAKLGWDVVLFPDMRGEKVIDGIKNVSYHDFFRYVSVEQPDVVIESIRHSIYDYNFPEVAIKVAWLHDLSWGLEGEWPDYVTEQRDRNIDYYFFMSKFQKNLIQSSYGIPTNERSYLTRSGIKLERFPEKVDLNAKNRYKLIYSSSPDRGLLTLLDIFREIRKEVPQAELHLQTCFWNVLRNAASFSPAHYERAKEYVKYIYDRMREEENVFFKGRIPQNELAKEFVTSAVWVYPTNFEETMCLTALEASAGACAIVTSKLGALETTVSQYGTLIDGAAGSPSYNRKFIDEVVRLLKDDSYWEERCLLAKENVKQVTKSGKYYWDWEAIAEEWNDFFSSKLTTSRSFLVDLRRTSWTRALEVLEKTENDEIEIEIFTLENLFRMNQECRKTSYEFQDLIYGWLFSDAGYSSLYSRFSIRSLLARSGFSVVESAERGDLVYFRAVNMKDKIKNFEDRLRVITGIDVKYPFLAPKYWDPRFPFTGNFYELRNNGIARYNDVILILPTFKRIENLKTILNYQYEFPLIITIDGDYETKTFLESFNVPNTAILFFPEKAGMNIQYLAAVKEFNSRVVGIIQDDIFINNSQLRTLIGNLNQFDLISPRDEATAKIYGDNGILELNNISPSSQYGFVVNVGSCLLIRRDTLSKVDIFDPFIFAHEDHDISRKVAEIGGRRGMNMDICVKRFEGPTVLRRMSNFPPEVVTRIFHSKLYFLLKWGYEIDLDDLINNTFERG